MFRKKYIQENFVILMIAISIEIFMYESTFI